MAKDTAGSYHRTTIYLTDEQWRWLSRLAAHRLHVLDHDRLGRAQLFAGLNDANSVPGSCCTGMWPGGV
jgi:hypothetical protein